jgi:hypothetical protein
MLVLNIWLHVFSVMHHGWFLLVNPILVFVQGGFLTTSNMGNKKNNQRVGEGIMIRLEIEG